MSGEERDLPEGVKATTGGTFNPDDEYIYFVAGGPAVTAAGHIERNPHILFAVNELETKGERTRLERAIDSGAQVMLDSGIFNLAMTHARTHGVSHDVGLSMPPEEIDGFDKLWDLYGEIATTYAEGLWGVVELDQGGIENKPRTRARIEREFGITPIPVYHPFLDGWDYYDDIASNYDRICFGNLVKASAPARLRLIHTATERAKAYPYLWTHFLGYTPSTGLMSMPYRGSSDSSSWNAGMRWHQSWWSFSYLAPVSHYPRGMWSLESMNVGPEDHRIKASKVMGTNVATTGQAARDHYQMLKELHAE